MQLSLTSCLGALVSTAALANASMSPKQFDSSVLLKRWANPADRIAPSPVNMMIRAPASTAGAPAAAASASLSATAVNCKLQLPANPLTAEGLSTPFQLLPPCSMTVAGQRSFAEAAIFDPVTGGLSIYHPLVIDAGVTPAAAPVVPTIPPGASVAIWFGYNGCNLQLVDANGLTPDTSPTLGPMGAGCINGLAGVVGDVFGQVSWCNAEPFFMAVNAGIGAGTLVVPPLGVDTMGNPCPSSRSFKIVDACPSDNVPTQYLVNMNTRQTAQDTAANRANNPNLTVVNNASDEALLAHIINPLVGCKSFMTPSLDDPGAMVESLAAQEIQASQFQLQPLGIVPLNDPDCLLTATTTLSVPKTNQYRRGVNQPIVAGNINATVDPTSVTGALVPYCNGMISTAPQFFADFQAALLLGASPAACVGTNLFTFMCNRYLMSLTMLKCPPPAVQPVVCIFAAGACGPATSCVINLPNANGTTTNSTGIASPTMASVAGSSMVPTSAANPFGTIVHQGQHPDGGGVSLGTPSKKKHRKHKHRKL